jgi:hypothetical protein
MKTKNETLKDSLSTGLVSGTTLGVLYKFAYKASNKTAIIAGVVGFLISTTVVYYLKSDNEQKNIESEKKP